MRDFLTVVGPFHIMKFGHVLSIDFIVGKRGWGVFFIGWRSLHFRKVHIEL